MDGGVAADRDEIKGRNMWLVWTGGNDRFWDALIQDTFGTLDLLKTISSHPACSSAATTAGRISALVNEPCFEKPTGPDPKRFGLWLDQRRADCPPDPFAERDKYPGVKIGARGSDGAGRLLLRLRRPASSGCGCFPIRTSTRRPRKRWDPEALLQRPELLQRQGPGAAVSRRHVVRLLPCRAEPDQSAGRSGKSEVGESEFDRRRAVLLGRPALRLERGPTQLHLPAVSHLRARARSIPRWSRPTTSTIRAR